MFSDFYVKFLKVHLSICSFAASAPLTVDLSTKITSVNQSVVTRSRCMLVVIVSLSFFLLGQVYRMHRSGELTNDNFYFTYGLMISCFISNCVQVTVSLYPYDAAFLMNQVFEFVTDLKDEFRPSFKPNKDKMTRLFDHLMVGIQVMCLTGGAVTTCHFLMFPDGPMYPINELPYNWGKLFPVRVMQFIAWGLINLAGWSYIAYVMVSAGTYAMYIVPIVTNELRCSVGRKVIKYKTNGHLRKPETLRTIYRRLEILHLLMLDLFGLMLIPIQTLVYQLVLFCNLMLFEHWESLSGPTSIMLIIWSSFGAFGWTVTLHIGGGFYVHSRRTIASWKYHDWGCKIENKLMSKFRKSCMPLKLGYKKTFTIKKLSVLRFMRGVVRGTFRALLATKKKAG